MVSSTQATEPSHTICTVCMGEIDHDGSCTTTPCGHVFHFRCLARNLKTAHTCPVCRADLLTDPDETSDDASDGGSEGWASEMTVSSDSDLVSAQSVIEIEIPDVNMGDDPFQRLVDAIESVETRRDINIDLFVSESPTSQPTSSMHPPPCVLPPTAGNIIACLKEGDVTQVENMLSHDATLARATDASGDTLLHLAVTQQNEYLIRYLVTNVEMPINCTNRARMTPLHYAVFMGEPRLVMIVLNLGGSVHAADCSGRTPLHHAAMLRNSLCLDCLLDRGSEINAVDMAGDTALHYASRIAWVYGVRKLTTSHHCLVDAENFVGETPLHMASRAASCACTTLLVVAGANPTTKNKAGRVARPVTT